MKSEGGVFVNKTKYRVVRCLDLDGLPALFLKGVQYSILFMINLNRKTRMVHV